MSSRVRLLSRTIIGAVVAVLAATLAATAIARPKVCLVLSGGGARGAAHIGVIKLLEEMRVPIDCVTGTSMGSLVGAAYATGMSVAEMEAFIASISTELLFKDEPPRQDQPIRRKRDDRSILFGVELGLRDAQILLPKGIVTGIQLETMLRRLTRVHGYRKFDELPVPYRAVATDLVTGKAVVFSEGELANVMRASMSVPGAIAPAELDGRILVDGGLTNNLPVDVARAMGADVIIAVNLGTPLMKREELGSILGVMGQMINVLTEQNVQSSLASLRPTDILIEPALGAFSATDFDRLPDAVPIGEAAARAAAGKLAALGISTEAFAMLQQRRLAVPPPELRAIDEIRFQKTARVNAETMKAEMDTRPGEPLDPQVLDRDLRRLYGTGDLEHVNYRIIEEAGRRVLDIDAVEKSWGPNYLRFGLGLGSDLQGDTFFNLAASYRSTWLNSLGAEWRSDAQIGHTSRLATEFYQPLQPRRFMFVAPHAEIERRTVDLFQGGTRIARYDVRNSQAGLDIGADLGRYGEIRVGALTGTVKASLDTGPESLAPPAGRITQGALVARAIVDQLDSANFPRQGFAGAANLFASRRALGADDDYTKWDLDLIGTRSVGRHTLQLAVKAGGAFDTGTLPRYDLFSWGGFLQQSGYPTGAIVGERLTFGRLVYSYKLVNQKLLEGMYAGFSLEAGRMDRPAVASQLTGVLKSAAVFLALDSPLGPLYLGYGRAVDGNQSGYLYLGRP